MIKVQTFKEFGVYCQERMWKADPNSVGASGGKKINVKKKKETKKLQNK